MTQTHTFNFNGTELRVAILGGKPWFVATDVIATLYPAYKADGSGCAPWLKGVVHADDRVTAGKILAKRLGRGTSPMATLVNEAGLVALIDRAQRQPFTKAFHDWIGRRVLPPLSKLPALVPQTDEVEALRELADRLHELADLREAVAAAEQAVDEARRKLAA